MLMTLEEALIYPGDSTICTSAMIVRNGTLLVGLRHYGGKWKGQLPNNSLWTTPGGRSDPGDTIDSCLRRETAEETGIDQLDIIDFLGEIPGAKAGDRLFVFLCSTLQEPMLREPEKFERWDWFPIESIPEPFINPRALELLREKGRS